MCHSHYKNIPKYIAMLCHCAQKEKSISHYNSYETKHQKTLMKIGKTIIVL